MVYFLQLLALVNGKRVFEQVPLEVWENWQFALQGANARYTGLGFSVENERVRFIGESWSVEEVAVAARAVGVKDGQGGNAFGGYIVQLSQPVAFQKRGKRWVVIDGVRYTAKAA
jgi:hypothetical protein